NQALLSDQAAEIMDMVATREANEKEAKAKARRSLIKPVEKNESVRVLRAACGPPFLFVRFRYQTGRSRPRTRGEQRGTLGGENERKSENSAPGGVQCF